MTNDFSVEQKRPSVLPYAGVGLVGGGALGYTKLPDWVGKKPMTVDQMIEEMNDKDKFEARTKEGAEHATEWKDLQAQAVKVEKAKEELAEASKPQLKGRELDELNTAKKNFDDKLKELQAEADRKAGVSSTTVVDGNFPKAKDIPDLATVQKNNPNSINAVFVDGKNAGKSMTGKELTDTYKNLKGAIDREEKNLENIVNPLKTKRDNMIKDVKTLFNNVETATSGFSEEQMSKFFQKKYWNNSYEEVLTPQYKLVRDQALVQCGNPANITVPYLVDKKPESLISVSHIWERGEKIDSSTHERKRMKNAEGEWNWYVFSKEDAAKVVEEEKTKLNEKVDSVADDMFNQMREVIEQRKGMKPAELATKFENLENRIVDDKIAAKTGLYDSTKGTLDIGKLIGSSKKVELTDIQTAKATHQNYIKTLQSYKLPKDTKLTKAQLDAIGLKGCKDVTAGKAKEMLGARVSTLKSFETYINKSNEEINRIIEESPMIKELADQIAEKKAGYEPLTKAQETFSRQFGDVEIVLKDGKKVKISEYATASVSSSSTAEKILESDSRLDSLRKIVKDKQKLHDEAAKNGGKIDEALKTAKEKALNEEQAKLTKMGEELSGKIGKVPGMNKLVGLAIGAAALGLVGLGIGKAVNKNKNA